MEPVRAPLVLIICQVVVHTCATCLQNMKRNRHLQLELQFDKDRGSRPSPPLARRPRCTATPAGPSALPRPKSRKSSYLRAQAELGELLAVLKCTTRVGMRLQQVLRPQNNSNRPKTMIFCKTDPNFSPDPHASSSPARPSPEGSKMPKST